MANMASGFRQPISVDLQSLAFDAAGRLPIRLLTCKDGFQSLVYALS